MVLRHSGVTNRVSFFSLFHLVNQEDVLLSGKKILKPSIALLFLCSKGYSAYLLLIILTQGQNYNIVMLNCNKQCPLKKMFSGSFLELIKLSVCCV